MTGWIGSTKRFSGEAVQQDSAVPLRAGFSSARRAGRIKESASDSSEIFDSAADPAHRSIGRVAWHFGSRCRPC